MQQTSILVFLQLLVHIIIVTEGFPVSKDQPLVIYSSNKRYQNFKWNPLVQPDFLQAIQNKDADNCGNRCSNTEQQENLFNEELHETLMKKKDVLTRSWGAGGMPFSVLYMNPKPPKSLRSPIIAEPLRSPPPHSTNSAAFIPPMAEHTFANNILDPEETDIQRGGGIQAQALTGSGGGGAVGPLPTRRQYSIIPQLFVSYGWGPLGK